VRDELAVQQRVHDEAGGIVREPDLLAAEVEQRLDVRARRREDAPPAEVGVGGPVHVAGDDPAHLRMRRDDLSERPPLGRRNGVPVEGRDPGVERRVVQRDERGNVRGGGEGRLEPGEAVGVELAAILAGPMS
jgi:hypothetical protein